MNNKLKILIITCFIFAIILIELIALFIGYMFRLKRENEIKTITEIEKYEYENYIKSDVREN